jgi:hypothetical protein
MATDQQIAANRLNSQKSTGPRTPEGKEASRMNALKTGIFAMNENIRGEGYLEYEALIEEFYAQFQPATPADRSLVDQLVSAEWNLRRCRRLEAQMYEVETDRLLIIEGNYGGNNSEAYVVKLEAFSRLHRRMQSLERCFRNTLELLEKRRTTSAGEEVVLASPESLRNLLPPEPIGFVPPTAGRVSTPASLIPGRPLPQSTKTKIGFVPSNTAGGPPARGFKPLPAPCRSRGTAQIDNTSLRSVS